MRIPYLTRLLEIKELQLKIENQKLLHLHFLNKDLVEINANIKKLLLKRSRAKKHKV